MFSARSANGQSPIDWYCPPVMIDQKTSIKSADQPVLLLSVASVAKTLNRSKAGIYELCAIGELRSIKVGASVLIPVGETQRKRHIAATAGLGSTR